MFSKKNLLHYFKNNTVFQVLRIVFFLFLCYACVDVSYKVNELNKYDVNRLLADIQQKYPKSELTFQNIYIEGNHLKEHSYQEHYDETYFESKYVYIKDNKLQQEPNFLWLLYGFAPLMFLTIFHEDPRTLKVKDLNKVSLFTWSWIFGSIIISLIIYNTTENKYHTHRASPNEFKYETEALLNKINLIDYKLNEK